MCREVILIQFQMLVERMTKRFNFRFCQILKFQHQMSYREIAEVTSLSESNVGYLIHVGIQTLRQQSAQF